MDQPIATSKLDLVADVGGVGRKVLDPQRAQDVPVRAMVRRDGRTCGSVALGVEAVLGDLTRPESVSAALEGVGRMVAIGAPEAIELRR